MNIDLTEQEKFEKHIKSVLIYNMKTSLDILDRDNLDDHVFDFAIRSLENGLSYLISKRNDEDRAD